MALTNAQKNRIAAISARRIFTDPRKTATVNKDDLAASAAAIDAKLDTSIDALEVGTQFDAALDGSIPAPVSSLTAAEKALHFAVTVAVRHGAL